jgi:membrane-associated phospholipid phosphatase
VHRPRPGADIVNVLQQLNDFSFPSGHVLTYTAFFGFLFFLGYTLLKPSFARTVLLAILGSLVALIGISRIYVGDHWASDVIGAYLLGSLWLALSVYIYRWGKTRFFVRQPPGPGKARAT